MFRRHRRLITPETARLSRPEPRQAKPKRPYGLVIESAGGIRFAYAATPLPQVEADQLIEDPRRVEGARMMAATIVKAEAELPVMPFPDAHTEETASE